MPKVSPEQRFHYKVGSAPEVGHEILLKVACSLRLFNFVKFSYRYKNSDKPRNYFEIILGFKQANIEIDGAFSKTAPAAQEPANR